MAYNPSNEANAKKKYAEETGQECLFQMQMRILSYLEDRRRQPEAEEEIYCPLKPYKGGLGVVQTYSKMAHIYSMLIYNEKNASHCMTFLNNDKKIIVGTSRGTLVTLNVNAYLNPKTIDGSMALRNVKQFHDQSINSMRLSRTGNWLVTGEKNGVVKYFQPNIQLENIEELKKSTEKDPKKHEGPIRDIAFAPTDEKLVTCSDDKTLRIADFERGSYEKILVGHGSDVTTVDWHPHLSLLASGGKDRIIMVWDAKSGIKACSLYNHTNSISKIRFSDDGKYMISCGRDQMVLLFDVRTMKVLNQYKGHDSDIHSLSWNPALANLYASCDQKGKVCVWDINATKPLCSFVHGDCDVWELSWNKLGTILASCGGDKLVKLWTPADFIAGYNN